MDHPRWYPKKHKGSRQIKPKRKPTLFSSLPFPMHQQRQQPFQPLPAHYLGDQLTYQLHSSSSNSAATSNHSSSNSAAPHECPLAVAQSLYSHVKVPQYLAIKSRAKKAQRGVFWRKKEKGRSKKARERLANKKERASLEVRKRGEKKERESKEKKEKGLFWS